VRRLSNQADLEADDHTTGNYHCQYPFNWRTSIVVAGFMAHPDVVDLDCMDDEEPELLRGEMLDSGT
jgi:hypothetical protein